MNKMNVWEGQKKQYLQVVKQSKSSKTLIWDHLREFPGQKRLLYPEGAGREIRGTRRVAREMGHFAMK